MTCMHEAPKHAHGLCRRCYDGQRRGPMEGEVRAERPGVKLEGDRATVTTAPTTDLGDLERLIRERGLDPADWEVVSATLNEWDGPTSGGGAQKLRQLKVQLKRRQPLSWLFPAADVAQRAWQPGDQTLDCSLPQKVVLLPDPHCPYHDRELEKRVQQLIFNFEPHRVVCLGDVCDFSSISKHRDNPAWFATVQENVQAGFEWLSGIRDATPAPIDWIEGNHDARIRYELLQRAERMYGIKPAEIPGVAPQVDALSLQHLLHLDRLGVNWVGPSLEGDEYKHAGIDIGPDLHARHGYITGQNSPAKTMDAIGMSVVLGHTHRQDLHHKTLYRGARPIGRMVAVECGYLGRLDGGLGYAVNARWQQGLAVATIWPDGSHDVELVPYEGKALRFRGRRY